MKRKTTEEILAESFQEVAAQKNANKITINDIVSNCGISSATFYRHFRDKYDLIGWIYRKRCSEIFHTLDGSPKSLEKIITNWVSYCAENRVFLVNLIENTDGYDSFVQKMVELHVQTLEDYIIAQSGTNALTKNVRMKVYLHASGVVRLMCAWLMGKISAAPEDLAESIVETMPASILQLIIAPD